MKTISVVSYFETQEISKVAEVLDAKFKIKKGNDVSNFLNMNSGEDNVVDIHK